MYNSIAEYISNKEKELFLKENQKQELLSQKNSLTNELNNQETLLKLKQEVEEFLKKMSMTLRKDTIERLEYIITTALRHILGEEISFKIETPTDKPEAYFYIVNDYNGTIVQNEPEDSRGGGIIDIVSVALRLAVAELCNIDGPLILDEPAKHLSAEYKDNFASFLRMMRDEFNRQIIIITHDRTLSECGDIIYSVDKINGKSDIKRLK